MTERDWQSDQKLCQRFLQAKIEIGRYKQVNRYDGWSFIDAHNGSFINDPLIYDWFKAVCESWPAALKKVQELEKENYAFQSRINELEEYISQSCCSQIEANKRISEEQQRWLELIHILKDIHDVMQETSGIAGWHLNGDIAAWNEFEFVSLIKQALEAPGETQSQSKVKEYVKNLEEENQKLRSEVAILRKKVQKGSP